MTAKSAFLKFASAKLLLGCGLMSVVSGCAHSTLAPFKPESLVREKVSFVPQKPEKWELPNGLAVFYKYDAELPSVRARLYLPGGSLFVPNELAGTAEAVGAMLREGGFVGMPPETLDKKLDDLAAGVETSVTQLYGVVACSSLKDDFTEVFGYASEIVQHPAFNAARFDLWKKASHQAIDRRKDNPGSMGALILAEQVYGVNTPYSSYPTHETVNRITLPGMRDFHRHFIQPHGARLVVTGAITKEELNKLLDNTLAKWKAPDAITVPPLPPAPALGKPGIYVLERDFDQSTVLFGHVGPAYPTNDLPEISIFNRLFGDGGFGNVLMQEIRTKLGLAYGVGGAVAPGIGVGMFEIELATRNEEALRAIDKILEVTARTLKEPSPDSEVEGAKSAVERAFIFKFDTAEEVTNRAAQQEILGFSPDYDSKYISKVEAITPATAMQIGNKYVHPEHLVIVVIGRIRAEKFAEAFKGRGIPVYRVAFDQKPKIVGEVH